LRAVCAAAAIKVKTAQSQPESVTRRTLQSIFRKKLAPDLIRGECRFSARKCE